MQDLFDRVEKMKRKASELEELEKVRQNDKKVDEEPNQIGNNQEENSLDIKKVQIKEEININDLVKNYDIDDRQVEEILDKNINSKEQIKKMKRELKKEKKQAKKEKNTKRKSENKVDINKNIYFFVCAFFIYCFIGWIYEVIWEFKVGNGFVNRGFLYGPYLPIYGFGVLTLYFMLKKFLKTKIKIGKINIMPIFVFIMILVIASIIEYIVSFGMEVLFQKRWWDYSYDFLNVNGRISLRNSSLLAIGAFILLYGVQPILEKTIRKINGKVLKVLATIIVLVVGVDFIITMLGYANIITI